MKDKKLREFLGVNQEGRDSMYTTYRQGKLENFQSQINELFSLIRGLANYHGIIVDYQDINTKKYIKAPVMTFSNPCSTTPVVKPKRKR